jgi:polar amino acid transport system substrate-binding protein
LLKNTVVRVGIDGSWYPLSLYGKESNFVGFSSDLLAAISKASEIKLRPIISVSSDLLQDVNNGFFDGALTFLQPSISNENQYVFSEPFYLLGPVLMAAKNDPIYSLQDMEGKTVGVRESYPLVFEVSYPSMQIATYDNMNRAMSDLLNNRIDGVIMDVLQAHVQMSIWPDKFKIVPPSLSKEGLRLISLNNPISQELVTLFNEGLENVQKEGVYQQLLDKWNLYNTMPEN